MLSAAEVPSSVQLLGGSGVVQRDPLVAIESAGGIVDDRKLHEDHVDGRDREGCRDDSLGAGIEDSVDAWDHERSEQHDDSQIPVSDVNVEQTQCGRAHDEGGQKDAVERQEDATGSRIGPEGDDQRHEQHP